MNSAMTIEIKPKPSIHRDNCAPATLVKRVRYLLVPPLPRSLSRAPLARMPRLR